MLGKLTDVQIDLVLYSQLVGRIGCYAEGRIYVVPITYVFHQGFIYAQSNEGLKLRMMRINPHVCFQTEVMENMANWRSVIAWGEFEILEGEQEQKRGLEILSLRLAPIITSKTATPNHDLSNHPPQVVKKGVKTTVYRIRITEKTGRFEKSVI